MPLIIKCNVQVENRDSYFKNQWWNHYRQQKKNVMTDASLVGTNIGGFSAVQVHKAVIMNWCPVLKETGKNEDPVFLFPDDSVDVIRAFVRFVYEGFFVLTESVTVEQVLDFMSRIGLDLPHGSYRITQYNIPDTVDIESPLSVKGNDAESSEAFTNEEEVSVDEEGEGDMETNVASVDYNNSHDFNDLNPSIDDDENGNPRRSLRVQRSTDTPDPGPESGVSRRGRGRGRGRSGRGRGAKTSSLVKELVPNASHYTRTRRRSSPVQKCRFCNFTSKLVKDLIIHSAAEHPNAVYNCSECSYEYSSLTKLKQHQANKKHYPKEKIQDTPETNVNHPSVIFNNQEKSKEPDVKRVKRKLTFEAPNCSVGKDNSATKEDRYNNVDNIEAELKLLGEGEDEGTGEAEEGRLAPLEPMQSDPLNGSSLRLACSAANCKMSVPITNDSPDGAQEIVYQHQRTVHGYDDNQFSAQVIDSDTDGSPKYFSGTRALPVHEASSDNTNFGYWERKLKRKVKNKLDLGVDEIKFDVKKRTGSQVNTHCIIRDKVFGEGVGDSDCASRDDAAFKAYYMVSKND